MIHRIARWMGNTFCPSLWHRLVLWKSARAEHRFWQARAEIVQGCPDNDRLSRVPGAGHVIDGLQTMHNGIRVLADGFYGKDGTCLIAANKGCHEPQEEVVFDAILKVIPTGGIMMELGAYWGFYSLWFMKDVPEAKVYLVEPEQKNLDMGTKNFEVNACQGHFIRSYVGAEDGVAPDGVRIACVSSLMSEHGLRHLNILHSDIQGFELDMLRGAGPILADRQVDYLFISTHSMELHRKCEAFLVSCGYRILTSVTLEESYSVDGVLVACSPLVSPPAFEQPAKRHGLIP